MGRVNAPAPRSRVWRERARRATPADGIIHASEARMIEAPKGPLALLGKVERAEKLLLSGRGGWAQDFESAVTFFLECLRGFGSFDLDRPCVTVVGSGRFGDTDPLRGHDARRLEHRLQHPAAHGSWIAFPSSSWEVTSGSPCLISYAA